MLIATPYYFISCYRYVMVMLLLCYTYRQQSMNKHSKNSVKANFQHLILNKTAFSSHLPKNQPLIDIERIVHSKHPKHSELDEETAFLIEALEKHERYSLRKLQLEREKYLNHFKLMHRTLEDECSAGLLHLSSCMEDVRQLFACKRRNIKSKKEYLERRGQLCGEEKLLQLRKESIFEAIFFEVHLSDLSTFRADIQKYTMSPWEKAIASSLRTDQQTCKISSQDLPSPVLFKQQAAQTDSPSHQQSAEESEDDILCCQEQLGRKISNTSRRRRRYAVGRRDVIREEDESEASSLISESEGLC